MRYVMSSKWSLLERFEITDESGAPQFEARGHIGSQVTLHDNSGREVADFRRPVFGDTYEVYLAGQLAAQVRHVGFLRDRYEIDTSLGPLTANGSFGGNYTLDQGGAQVASMVRQFSLRGKLAIDIADGQNDTLVLAVMLAVELIRDRRRQRAGLM